MAWKPQIAASLLVPTAVPYLAGGSDPLVGLDDAGLVAELYARAGFPDAGMAAALRAEAPSAYKGSGGFLADKRFRELSTFTPFVAEQLLVLKVRRGTFLAVLVGPTTVVGIYDTEKAWTMRPPKVLPYIARRFAP